MPTMLSISCSLIAGAPCSSADIDFTVQEMSFTFFASGTLSLFTRCDMSLQGSRRRPLRTGVHAVADMIDEVKDSGLQMSDSGVLHNGLLSHRFPFGYVA